MRRNSRERRRQWLRLQRLEPTFEAILWRLPARFGGRRRKRKTHLRRIHTLHGIAFTILRCAKCNWQVHLEAHHRYGNGRPRSVKHKDKAYRKWRGDMLRRKVTCPKCSNDTWRYVRTEVADYGPDCKLYSELAE
jgi:hypothetical protein